MNTFKDLLLHPEPSGPQNQDDPGHDTGQTADTPPLGAGTASLTATGEGCHTLEHDFAALHQAQERRAAQSPPVMAEQLATQTRIERWTLRTLHSPFGLRGVSPDDHPDVESAIDFIHQARKEAHNVQHTAD